VICGSRVSRPRRILRYTEHGLGWSFPPDIEHGLDGINQMFILPYTEHGLGGVNQMFILRYRARARWSFPPLHRAWARGSLGCSFIPPGTRALSRGRLILAVGFGCPCFRVLHIKTLFIMLIGLSLWVCPCLSLWV